MKSKQASFESSLFYVYDKDSPYYAFWSRLTKGFSRKAGLYVILNVYYNFLFFGWMSYHIVINFWVFWQNMKALASMHTFVWIDYLLKRFWERSNLVFLKQAAIADQHGLLDDCSVDIQNLSLSPGSKEDEVVSLWPSSLKLSLVGCKESKNTTSSNKLLHLEGPKVNLSNRFSQLIIEGLSSKSCQLAAVYNDFIHALHKNNLVEDLN